MTVANRCAPTASDLKKLARAAGKSSPSHGAVRCISRWADFHQPFPQDGQLAKHLDSSLKDLRKALDGRGEAYCYVIDTLSFSNRRLLQTGSGPNLQGGFLTLCTCKHQMRSRLSTTEWRGKWLAGFTGVSKVDRGNYLFYLARVDSAFETQRDLWFNGDLPESTKEAKSASRDRLGDLYVPRGEKGNPYDPSAYKRPRIDHTHAVGEYWRKDIYYQSRGGSFPPMLVCDPAQTFLWTRPLLRLKFQLPRDYTIRGLGELLSSLEIRAA